MSTDTMEWVTRPLPEHEWLRRLVGSWRVESQMQMPSGETIGGQGAETVRMLGDLWAYAEGTTTMPNGAPMESRFGLGYDVSFREYRGFWVASASSHLWQYVGALSNGGAVMTLNCVGPDMERDGETANYRDVIEILDDDHRTLTSYGQTDSGEWARFMKATYTRI